VNNFSTENSYPANFSLAQYFYSTKKLLQSRWESERHCKDDYELGHWSQIKGMGVS
jgi:hypothetical protein